MRFAGYAALFDKADAARDTIRKGAFARTLTERRDPLPLYWQHRPDQRIGWIRQVSEDDRGLRVVATIDNPDGRAGTLLRANSVSGLSFGYRTRAASHSSHGRLLEEVDLVEVSLVTHPLQHGARVHFIAPQESPEER
ncbi:HK97 family phage prohead protease [Tsuneonella dongtanensis]|uniref:HK97 family phage prohead protease n=1 Tax=Tsuneonella dongtanensis TaxID=692370 RepID=UPI00082E280F|nr:HK97 family phage prohead protease [Tsuneonella dongtanensis]